MDCKHQVNNQDVSSKISDKLSSLSVNSRSTEEVEDMSIETENYSTHNKTEINIVTKISTDSCNLESQANDDMLIVEDVQMSEEIVDNTQANDEAALYQEENSQAFEISERDGSEISERDNFEMSERNNSEISERNKSEVSKGIKSETCEKNKKNNLEITEISVSEISIKNDSDNYEETITELPIKKDNQSPPDTPDGDEGNSEESLNREHKKNDSQNMNEPKLGDCKESQECVKANDESQGSSDINYGAEYSMECVSDEYIPIAEEQSIEILGEIELVVSFYY